MSLTIVPAIVRSRSTPRAVAIGLYVTAFATVGAGYPYIPLFFQSLGLPLDAIGLIAAVAALCGLVAAPAWGVVADQIFGARVALMAAALLATLWAVGVAIANEAVLAALLWILCLIAFAGIAPILDAFALDQVGANQHRYARFRVWGSASFVVTVVLTGLLIERSDIRVMFAVVVPCLLASALFAALVPARTSVRAQRSLSGLGALLRNRALVSFLLAALLCWSASTMINGFFSIYLGSLDTPAALVGSAWALGALVEVPVMLVFPVLAVRFGVGRLVVVGAAFLLLRAIVVVLATDPLLVVASMALHGAGYALLLVGGVMYVAGRAPKGSAATAQGVLAGVVSGLAQAIGPGIAGFIAGATSIHAMFSVAALGSAVGVAVVALAVGWYARRSPTAPDLATAA